MFPPRSYARARPAARPARCTHEARREEEELHPRERPRTGRAADPPLPPSRRRLRRRRRAGRGRRALLIGLPLALVVLVAASAAAVSQVARAELEALPESCSLSTATVRSLGQTSFVYAADGTYLGAISSETYRQEVSLAEMSDWLVNATVAIEDRRFWEHDGIDFQGIARAAAQNLQAREIVEGASTITQQLARTMFLTSEQTLERKYEEMCLALNLEEHWTKDRILETYMNRVFYGHRAYGVEAASQIYFSRRASQLGPAQAALVAGMTQAPSLYDPFRNPERALQRRNEVLRAMRDTGALGPLDYAKAVQQPLSLRRGSLFETRREPYFFEYVRQLLVERYGEQAVRHGGLRIHTTIDPRLQQHARQALRDELGQSGDPSSAIVTLDPANGAIRAMTSLTPGARPDFNLAVQGRRQSGSSFKTFALVEALRRGADPDATTYESREFTYVPGPGQEPWTPKTFDGTEYGRSTLTQATLRSDNLVYAKLTLDLGPETVASTAKAMGIETELSPVASIGLGSNDVTVLEMAAAYATLASGGVRHRPYAIDRVELTTGEVDESSWGPERGLRVIADWVAREATEILEENIRSGTGTAAQLGRPAAGKTGTTDDYTNAWFVGYTPQLATAVWVGFPNRTAPMTNVRGIRVTGGSFPAAIWGRYMRPATEPLEWRDWPEPASPPEWERWSGAWTGGRSSGAWDDDAESG